MRNVYLDHHATTPVDPRVLEAMLPFLREDFGNASSKTHPYGWKALEAVEAARGQVASLIGASPREIVFTSGATEANNIALLGTAARAPGNRSRIVTQATEHHAVLEPLEVLEKRGFPVKVLRPGPDGIVRPGDVEREIGEDTLLVSVMAAQNEVGSIQPLEEIGALCDAAGVLFHTDAAQAVGRVPLDVERMKIDLLSLSAHKFYGPKGVGALYVRRRRKRVKVAPIAFGGGQEGGIRPGTLNVPGIVGVGEACRVARDELPAEMERLAALRDRLWRKIREGLPEVRLNGPEDFSRRLPGNLSLSFPDVDGSALVLELQDIAASSGSACTTGNAEPSYVLKALGVRDDLAAAALRLCVGRFNTEDEIDFAAGRVVETGRKLRLAPR